MISHWRPNVWASDSNTLDKQDVKMNLQTIKNKIPKEMFEEWMGTLYASNQPPKGTIYEYVLFALCRGKLEKQTYKDAIESAL